MVSCVRHLCDENVRLPTGERAEDRKERHGVRGGVEAVDEHAPPQHQRRVHGAWQETLWPLHEKPVPGQEPEATGASPHRLPPG